VVTDTLIKTRIEKIAAGGAGLGRIEGKSVFIEGSAPGETVLCRVIKEHRSWLQAEMVEIVEASQDRIQPACQFYGKCGGCNMQHLNYSAQLAAKTTVLQDSLTRIGGFSQQQPAVQKPAVLSSKPWEYRNRMQFHTIRQDTSNVVWGLKARKSTVIVPVSDCPIADPGIREMLQQGFLPPEKDRFTVYARNGLFLCEGGEQRGKTRILNRDITLDTGLFFQSNGAMLEQLITDIREIAVGADRNLPMADLYCGVGTFAAFLGDLFPYIDLVEEDKTALILAHENLSWLNTAAFYAQRSEVWAKNSLKRRGMKCRYGFMVVDPPRQGLNPALTAQLAANGPPLLVYVSCDPATLARDSKILAEGGYRLTELRWYDFYPQTVHIESLALFAR
jgi:23S rRNA (uracil1939-C5)-methyltransferase